MYLIFMISKMNMNKGEAAINISSSSVHNWHDLKAALLNCYANKHDSYALALELAEMKQN